MTGSTECGEVNSESLYGLRSVRGSIPCQVAALAIRLLDIRLSPEPAAFPAQTQPCHVPDRWDLWVGVRAIEDGARPHEV